jgi:alanine racemase
MLQNSVGKLTIDCAALRSNYTLLRQKVGKKVDIAAVVKANAYGLGAIPITRELASIGCTRFFVANIAEALSLREHFPSITILILNGFYKTHADLYIKHNLTPVIGSFDEIESYKHLAKKTGKNLPAYLHFNTRMNRLGLGAVETEKLLKNLSMLDGLNIECIMSHLACADEASHPLNEIQLETFKKIIKYFPDILHSLANSSAIFRGNTYHFDLVRPGMALYGLNPTPETTSPMQPVITLTAPVIRTRTVYKDAYIGYGATYQFEKDTPLATLAIGYADGLHWCLSNQGTLYWQGIPCPIRGRISMDLTTIDLSSIPENQRPKPGDRIEIIGPSQSPADLAAKAHSFDYEILTSLGNRYERHYINQT